jgi:uracil-DNA glycosylase family protein
MKKLNLPGASQWVPKTRSLAKLAAASKDCRGCELYKNATQTVFGEGNTNAAIIVIGEQPGDLEDREGAAFVGPAGRVLDETLEIVGIPRSRVYITNAVKHFKWTPRGKRRMHQRPLAGEITACRPWLSAELAAVQADVIVCLGATAAQALFGPSFRLMDSFDKDLTHEDRHVIVTYHPSAILRMPTPEAREDARRRLRHDLERAWTLARRKK